MIFEDASRRRWKATLAVFALLLTVSIALIGTLLAGAIINPPLPSIQEKSLNRRVATSIKRQIQNVSTLDAIAAAAQQKRIPPKPPLSVVKRDATSFDVAALKRAGHAALTTAFLVQGDINSLNSFKAHANELDVVFPDWYTVTQGTCSVNERTDPDVFALLQSSPVSVIPRVSNGDDGVWHKKEVEKILANAELRSCVAHVLSEFAHNNAVIGLNVDIESLDPEDRDNYLEFLKELADLLHGEGRALTVDVPSHDPAFDLEYIGGIADAVVVMAYDEHYPGGMAGPIASQDWFSDALDEAVQAIPPSKLIVAMGSYAYDWQTTANAPTAEGLSFSEAMSMAKDIDAEVELDPTSRTMAFGYKDESGRDHQVWLLNGVSAWNEWTLAKKRNVLGYGLWRLGTEDPALWSFISKASADPFSLRTTPALDSITYLSQGELFRMRAAPTEGKLDLTTDTDGTFDYAHYLQLPSGYVLERVGKDIPPKTLVLSFDDGPDPVWTPQLLRTLEQLHVPAVFFLVGDQAQKYPDIVRTEARAGYLVGNHTYLHTNLQDASKERGRLELNSTQRTIESSYGRRTVLFRPPYDTDATPDTPEQMNGLTAATDLGYYVVGANIDSGDWRRPGVDKIVSDVMAQAAKPDAHIIVMHDSGGDRSETIAAVAQFVPALEAKGYRFASLNDATGLTRNDLNPPLSPGEQLFVVAEMAATFIRIWGWTAIVWLFFLTTGFSIIRIVFLGALVVRSSLREQAAPLPTDHPLITVIIPAYNEKMTIEKTLRTLLKSSYARFEAIVIDDGSTDGMGDVVQAIGREDRRIALIRKPNGGKASSLNLGFQRATTDIVVTIDADTIVYPDTIAELVRPFSDPAVDAVCGNVEVGNVHNLLTGFQALEYITTQNFDRRAFDELNCISVVPGATGAWRKDKVIALGGYSDDTLTEDADITLRLLRAGGRIVYAPAARSRTEAPETVAALAKQRFRWSYGTFQCLYKHRDALFKGTLGWIALPNMFLFQILFPILSPIGDLVFVLALLRGDLKAILAGYLLFLTMDVCGSLLAFTLERRPKTLMWLALIQRFYYRQFMYVITFRAIVAILRGERYGWNKLQRTGSVLTESVAAN